MATTIKTRFGNLVLTDESSAQNLGIGEPQNATTNNTLISSLAIENNKLIPSVFYIRDNTEANNTLLVDVVKSDSQDDKPHYLQAAIPQATADQLGVVKLQAHPPAGQPPIANLITTTSDGRLIIENVTATNIPIATAEQIGGVRSIETTAPNELPLLNSIKVHKEPVTAQKTDGTEVENVAPGWMEVNSLSTDKLEQIENHWLILDSVNAAANWDGSEAK